MEPCGLQIQALQVIVVPLVEHPSVAKLFLDVRLGLFTHPIGRRQRGRVCLSGHRGGVNSVWIPKLAPGLGQACLQAQNQTIGCD